MVKPISAMVVPRAVIQLQPQRLTSKAQVVQRIRLFAGDQRMWIAIRSAVNWVIVLQVVGMSTLLPEMPLLFSKMVPLNICVSIRVVTLESAPPQPGPPWQ